MLQVVCNPSNLPRASNRLAPRGGYVRAAIKCCNSNYRTTLGTRVFSAQASTKPILRPIGALGTVPWRRAVPWIGTVVAGCALTMVAPSSLWDVSNNHKTDCDVALTVESNKQDQSLTIKLRTVDDARLKKSKSKWDQVKRALRLVRRVLKLMIALSPVVALYPVHYLLTMTYPSPHNNDGDDDVEDDAHQVALARLGNSEGIPSGPIGWYYRLCLHCVEFSGAAAIKMMQWAGSRPDMFGQSFCNVFSQLQDDTTPHGWKHTEESLRKAFGENWRDHLRLYETLGSGCIAQVYRGVIFDDDGKEQQIAVKVKHPNVDDDIDADLDIMRLSTHVLEALPFDVFRNLKWLNLPGFIEEMATMLSIQLDLRQEADHLERFNENFKDNDKIIFPKLVEGYKPTKEVLVETFCEGDPIMDFVRNNTENQSVLHEMCKSAILAVCQMIFLDNFIHGDLHPGNVLVNKEKKFVLLDVGIVVENNDEDHRLISDVLASFIRKDGRKAGRRMMEDSNHRMKEGGEHAVEEEKFLDKMEGLTIKASEEGYFMEHLGAYIGTICNAAAKHHVMLNQAFVSAALAVKVQEGIALALDPSIQIWRIAIPVILEGERRHGYVADRAKEFFGFQKVTNWLRGTTSQNSGGKKERA